MLAGEGKSLREQRERGQRIRTFLSDENLEMVRCARQSLLDQAPLLYHSTGHATPEAEVISGCLLDPELPNRFKELAQAAVAINSTYRGRFGERHQQRLTDYRAAIQSIKAQSEYRALEPTEAESALVPLTLRASETFDLPEIGRAHV